MKKTLEKYFLEHIENGIIDFSIRTSVDGDDTKFYIHPSDVSGETLDFVVDDNTLRLEGDKNV